MLSYNSGTGAFTTSADNFANWKFTTDSAGNTSITSGGLLTFTAGSGIDVTHSGSTITIATDSDADISAVSAGDGLTGGGVSGAVTLNVGAGYGITANANDLEVSNADIRALFSASGDLSYNSSTGAFSFTNDAGDIEGVTAGVGLSGGGTSGTVTLDLDFSELADMTSTMDASDEFIILDSGSGNKRKEAQEIGLSIFNNDSGFLTSVSGIGVSNFNAAAVQTSGESFSDNDTSFMTSAAIEDKILSYGYTTELTRDIQVQTGPTTYHQMGESDVLKFQNSDDVSYTINTPNTGDLKIILNTATANTPSTIVKRDGSGNFAANVITATATSARYADLAEKYEADAEYEPGTVLVIGGDKEVTVTDEPGSYAVVGVVSTDPAYLMNSEAEGVAIALRGRIPCKVAGTCKKGDVLITSNTPGHAMVAVAPNKLSPLQIIGRALAHKTEAAPGLVEIIV